MSRMYTPDAMGWTFEEPFRCVLYVHLSHLLMSNPRFDSFQFDPGLKGQKKFGYPKIVLVWVVFSM